VSLAVAGLALFVGLLISAALHFVVLWPASEPDAPAEPAEPAEPAAPDRPPPETGGG